MEFLAGIFRALPPRLDSAIVDIIQRIERARPAVAAAEAPTANSAAAAAATNVSLLFSTLVSLCVSLLAVGHTAHHHSYNLVVKIQRERSKQAAARKYPDKEA